MFRHGGLPPLTGSKCLVRESGRLGPWKNGVTAGGIVCAFGGLVADGIGKAELTIIAMALNGATAIAAAFTFGRPAWIMFSIVVVWGIVIVPDSPQFSALVADASPADQAGSLLALQTALGFALTIFTVQMTPLAAAVCGWPLVLGGLAIGPAIGIWEMWRFRSLGARLA